MIEDNRFRHKGLKVLWQRGDASRLKPEWVSKIKRVLAALNAAVSPEELRIPGFGFHQLKGDREGTYSVTPSRNWRLTFKWDEHGPYEIDLEDYHAR